MAILRIVNEAGWQPRAWVVVYASSDTSFDPEYSVTQTKGSQEGQRICKTGVGSTTFKTDCGTVLDLDVTFTYSVTSVTGAVRTETVDHLGKADYCRAGGDSGGPVYANHTAFGLHVASSSTCVAYYQGIKAAEDAMNVDVAHDAG